MTSSKHDYENCDQFVPNFDMAYRTIKCYLLTYWLAYLYGRIQSPRPVREGITRAAGFVFACIDTQAS